MRLVLATLALALPAAGCSLIYNPNNIDTAPIDGATPDVEVIIDADPSSLVLDDGQRITLTEGEGVDGSRPALFVLRGDQIVDGAIIELTDPATGLPHPSITFDPTTAVVAENHKMISVPVAVAVDPNEVDVALEVKLTQTGNGVPVSKTLTGAVTLHGLRELEGGMNVALPTGVTTFSKIAVGSLSLTGTVPIALRSTSSLTITGATSVNATTTTAGPGGGPGGAGGGTTAMGNAGGGTCGGAGGAGSAIGGGSPGRPGKLFTACNADEGISNLATNVSGGGGGGGGGTLNVGRAGGPGGGAIVLTAQGNMTVGAVTANGSAGPSGAFGTDGGAGSGGVIVLRAGGTLTATSLTAAGGPDADLGRIRVDNPTTSLSLTTMPSKVYRGPMFAADTVVITRTSSPTITVIGEPSTSVKLFISGETNEHEPASKVVDNIGIAAGGTSVIALGGSGLYRGLNTLCLEVAGATVVRDEARNCITVAYMMQGQ